MEHSVFHSFHNLVTKPNASREELTLLCRDYPSTPLTWWALHRFLPSEEAKSMLLEKARELKSVDLWRELLRLEESDVIEKYELAKEAVAAVGHDPRSGFLWATFLGLYASLHNSFLSLVTKEQEEQLSVGGSSSSIGGGGVTGAAATTSGVAPLGQLVPAEKSYSERHASTVGNLSISTFFTSTTTGQGARSAAVENAMLTSPLAGLAPEVGALVARSPPGAERLRALVAGGDLNLVSFCECLRKLCMTPVQEVPHKTVRQVLSTLMPEAGVEPAASALQKSAPLDFESLYPLALFQRPTSAVVPALEAVSVPGWTRILRMEMANWLQIRETDAGVFEERLSYFFAVALRQCANIPDIKFLCAQKRFSDGAHEQGLRMLLSVPAAEHVELALVVADVYDLLLNDVGQAVDTLCKALTKALHAPPPAEDAPHKYASQHSHAYLLGCLVYQLLLRRLRQQGGQSLEAMIYAVLGDADLKPCLTEDLLVSLLLLAATSPADDRIDLRALLETMLHSFPQHALLVSLQFGPPVAAPPDYLAAYTNARQTTAVGDASALLASLQTLALTYAYFFSPNTHQIAQLMHAVQPGMLCTPRGGVDYEAYIRFATALPSNSLTAVSATLLPTNAVTSPDVPVTASAVKDVIQLGRKLDTLVDIARQLRDSSLQTAKPGEVKASTVMQVFQRALNDSKHLLSERQIAELQQLTQDPGCLQSLGIWLNGA